MPNGNSIGLESVAGTGKANATGLEDQVDEHILGLVVAVLLSSIISADDSFIDGLGDSDAQQAASVGSNIVRRQLDIQPTITVHPGFRLNILAGRDILYWSRTDERQDEEAKTAVRISYIAILPSIRSR